VWVGFVSSIVSAYPLLASKLRILRQLLPLTDQRVYLGHDGRGLC